MQINDFNIVTSLVSSPSRSEVWKVTNRLLGLDFALKVTRLASDDEGTMEAALHESRILAQLEHPNIIRLHNCWTEDTFPASVACGPCKSYDDVCDKGVPSNACHCPSCFVAVEEDQEPHPFPVRYIFLQLDLCDCTLFDWMETPISTELSPTTRCHNPAAMSHNGCVLMIMQQLCKGLQYLHEQGIAHNNLKPTNVGLFNGTVKIIDFALSSTPPPQLSNHTKGGPSLYLPVGEHPSLERDIYSLGNLYYEMAISHQGLSRAQRHQHILEAQAQGRISALTTPGCSRLIASMLSPEPSNRPCAAAVLQDVAIEALLNEELSALGSDTGPSGLYHKESLEMLLDAAVVANEEGTILAVNKVAVHFFGYSEAELVGSNVTKLMPAPIAAVHGTFMRRYLSHGVPSLIGCPRSLKVRCNGGVMKECVARLGHQNCTNGHLFLACFQIVTASRSPQVNN